MCDSDNMDFKSVNLVKPNRLIPFSLCLPADVLAHLEESADQAKISRSQFARIAIQIALKYFDPNKFASLAVENQKR